MADEARRRLGAVASGLEGGGFAKRQTCAGKRWRKGEERRRSLLVGGGKAVAGTARPPRAVGVFGAYGEAAGSRDQGARHCRIEGRVLCQVFVEGVARGHATRLLREGRSKGSGLLRDVGESRTEVGKGARAARSWKNVRRTRL